MIKKWIKKFNEKLHKANEDDRGSAFVMVVIGVMATAIIGATVLSLATNYFVSVVVDQQGTDNYYETEAIVAEIRSGIEEVAGVSNEVAYMETLDSYNAASGELQDVYSKLYLSGIIYGIKNKSVENKYKNNLVNILEQIGRYVSLMLTIFPIGISGFKSAGYMLVYLIANVILLLLYLIIWICYFKSKSLLKTITLAIIPTIIFFVCGITLKHWGLIISSIIFGFAHTLITYKNNC